MAIGTALGVLALSTGVLAARPDRDPVRLLVSASVAGTVARRLLPAAVLVPAILAAVRLAGQDLGLYGTRVGAWLFGLAMVGVAAPVVWRLARSLEYAEQERARTAQALRVAREHADRDPLTDLFNRRRFDAELARFAGHARRYDLPGALLAVDLDGFKGVNDRHGHAAGDTLLRAIADALAACVRETDVLARLGGDEFWALLPYCDPPDAERIGQAVVTSVRAVAASEGVPVTASVGLVALDPEDVAAAQARADQAMYRAKHAGGDRLTVGAASPVMAASPAG
ncbi:MAG: GGDEF domain-containing protein [Solirubrobacterales bacterium]|nr:GGDEF domain-containing protein [Solirubrobacterales bacterium]